MNLLDLKKKYGLKPSEAEKMELLLLWFRNQNIRSVFMEEFDKRYCHLFGRYPLWYTWGPFYRDHGFVGVRPQESI